MRTWRLWVIVGILVLSAAGLLGKLLYMQTINRAFLDRQGDSRVERVINKHAFRGSIVDRHGYPMAISTPMDAIWVDPRFVHLDSQFRHVLDMLNLPPQRQRELINKIRPRLGESGFIYLKRQVNPYVSGKIEKMAVPGIHLQREYRRYYPDGEVAAHIIGFTNIDGKGQEGIERKYNQWLSGHPGKVKIWQDLKGNLIKRVKTIKPAEQGHSLALSIDRRIQYVAYKALKEAVTRRRAAGGSVVVMDVHTGEILAMANQPSFNPNNLADSTPAERRNRAVTDVVEPGSTMKTFSAIIALASGEYDIDTTVDTSPGYYRVGHKTVRDFRNYGELTLRRVLVKSSNVGISKIVLSLPSNKLPDMMRSFGFGSRTGLDFPGEQSGYVPMPRAWGDFPLATLSFGYGMNVTTLQLARAYAAIGNEGRLVQPSLIKINNASQVSSHRVIDQPVADKTLDMLNSVVEAKGGTGTKAQVEGYHVAGKTGTVRKAVAGGYATNAYMALFAGIAPASNPRLAIAVVIDDPKGDEYGGGSVAAPVFSQVMSRSLRLLNVPFDKIDPDEKPPLEPVAQQDKKN